MNRKFYLLFLAFAFSADINVVAQNTVNLQGYPNEKGKGEHRNVAPVIDYTKHTVSVMSKEIIGDVRIVVTDIKGNIIYNKVVDVLPSSTTLDIPEEYVSDKFKIELFYGKSKLYGYFDSEE